MAGWVALAGYVVAYDLWASKTGRVTLSGHVRRLDRTPPIRYLTALTAFYVWLHLFGPRVWPFTPWPLGGRR